MLSIGFLIIAEYAFGFQPVQPVSKDTTDMVVRRIRFSGNKAFNDSKLSYIVRTRTNREFLGIRGFTPWYWSYTRNNDRGEPPSYLVNSVISQDLDRLSSFYRSQGFLHANIDTTIVEFQEGKAEVSFMINEGPESTIENVYYSGITKINNEGFQRRFFKENELSQGVLNDTTVVVNRRYRNELISNEQIRIINLLKDFGYASVTRDSVRALVKPKSEDSLKLEVLFRIKTGPIYRFGNVNIDVGGPDAQRNYELSDTLTNDNFSEFTIKVRRETEADTRLDVIKDQLKIVPGQIYDNSDYLQTINRFQNLRMMRIQRFNLSEDGSIPDFENLVLPVYFDLQTIPKYQLGTDLFGMQRIGFGAGAGARISNNNLFGRAHTLELGLNANFEYVSSQQQLLRATEANLNYSIPKTSFPFRRLASSSDYVTSTTQYQITASQVNQINFDINANFRFNWRFNVRHNETYSSTLDLLEIDWLDANESSEFRNELDRLVQSGAIDELQRNIILNDYNPQVNSTIRYTFRDINTNVVKKDRGHFREYAIELSGNAPFALEKLVSDGGTIDGTIPSFSSSGSELFYSQFFKGIIDRRRYIPVGENNVFAMRGFAGLAIPYGQNPFLPINRRFFAGGPNDIRGWFPLRLGPGSLQDQGTINGGEIKLLGSLEMRSIIVRDVLAAEWVFTTFTDFGNVWLGPRSEQSEEGLFKIDEFYRQIAVGAGYGIRLDWDFVIFRIEMAYRIHDLNEGWFQKMGLIQDARLQFGIGHAF